MSKYTDARDNVPSSSQSYSDLYREIAKDRADNSSFLQPVRANELPGLRNLPPSSDSRSVQDLQSLVTTKPQRAELAPVPTKAAIESQQGLGLEPTLPRKAVGGSVSSPLTETAYLDRTFHPVQTLTSSDGLIVFEVQPLKSVTFQDAKGGEIELRFKAPST